MNGHTLHVVGPGAMGDHAPVVERIARALVARPDEPSAAPAPLAPAPWPLAPAGAAAPPVQGEQARARGFTGDMCASCCAFAMVRTGTCLTCTFCGTASGGCA